MSARREQTFASTARALAAAAEAGRATGKIDVAALAKTHGLDVDSLTAWFDYLGIGPTAAIKLDYLANKVTKGSNYDFIQGWNTHELPQLLANSSNQHVRVPGNMNPHSVCVHPSPTLFAAVGWRSPIAAAVEISGKVTHAHPECGNGVEWRLELRRGATRQRLAEGIAHGGRIGVIPQMGALAVQPGDLVSLLVGPRDGNHSCDLTNLELNLKTTGPQFARVEPRPGRVAKRAGRQSARGSLRQRGRLALLQRTGERWRGGRGDSFGIAARPLAGGRNAGRKATAGERRAEPAQKRAAGRRGGKEPGRRAVSPVVVAGRSALYAGVAPRGGRASATRGGTLPRVRKQNMA